MRHKNSIKFALIFFMAVICFCTSFNYNAQQPLSAKTINDEISETKNKLDNLQKKQDDLESALEKAKKDKSSSLSSKQIIEQQLGTLEDEIDTLNSHIRSLNKNVSTLEERIAATQKEYDETYEKFKQRIRANYENGAVSSLEIFLQSKNLSDFFKKKEYYASVMKYDNSLMEKLKEQIDSIKADKKEVEDSIEKTEQSVKKLDSSKQKQKAKQDELEKQIQSLTKNVEEYLAQKKELEKLEKEFEAQIQKLLDKQKTYSGAAFLWPVPNYTYISSTFGWRTYTINGGKVTDFHNALDMAAPEGTNVLASNAGTVIYAGWTNTGGGNRINIDHGSTITTTYCHLSKILVKVGDTVTKGQLIGLVGRTGNTTGSHLHFGISKNGEVLDPALYVTPDNSPPKKTLS